MTSCSTTGKIFARTWNRPSGQPIRQDLYRFIVRRVIRGKGAGWHQLNEPWSWGALAFVFSRPVLERFLVDPDVPATPVEGATGPAKAGIDALIGRWAARHGVPIHYPCPSLAQHTGDISVLWPAQRAVGNRHADRFLADVEPD